MGNLILTIMQILLCSIPIAQDWFCVANTLITLAGWVITLYIAVSINRKLDSERTLKNHFIEEVKVIRGLEEAIFNYILSDKVKPQQLRSMMGNLNTNVGDLMNLLKTQYGIDDGFLMAFQWKYSQLITDDESFTSNYKGNKEFKFAQQLLKNFTGYRSDKLHLFNDLIVVINNAKVK